MGLLDNHVFVSVLMAALLLVSAVVHEMAHALVAYLCGDMTAKSQGRLTPNPLAHLDPFGSFVLPLLMALSNGPVFAYAKPVPYNPNNLRKPARDEVLVALAGPFSNLLQAVLGGLVVRLLFDFIGITQEWQFVVVQVAYLYVYVNVSLMLFNLIPLPPLDGSAIISPLLHGKARQTYYKVQRYSLPILIALLYFGPMVLGFDPLGAYLSGIGGAIIDLIAGA